jgi:hypothetical protein
MYQYAAKTACDLNLAGQIEVYQNSSADVVSFVLRATIPVDSATGILRISGEDADAQKTSFMTVFKTLRKDLVDSLRDLWERSSSAITMASGGEKMNLTTGVYIGQHLLNLIYIPKNDEVQSLVDSKALDQEMVQNAFTKLITTDRLFMDKQIEEIWDGFEEREGMKSLLGGSVQGLGKQHVIPVAGEKFMLPVSVSAKGELDGYIKRTRIYGELIFALTQEL